MLLRRLTAVYQSRTMPMPRVHMVTRTQSIHSRTGVAVASHRLLTLSI